MPQLKAQAVNNQIKDVVMPSANAASLGKYGDIPVSYHTGVPNVGIPIHTVQDGPLSIPIALSYHAGGLKVGEPCSWVGQNWSLQAGGMISRTVQGKADERVDGYFEIGQYLGVVATPVTLDPNNQCITYANPNYTYSTSQYTAEVASGGKDSEPDIFSFSVGGYSGKFYIEADMSNDGNVNGKVVTIPKQDVKIDYALDGNNSNIKRLSKFTIITPDGVKYEFGNIGDGDINDGIEITKPFNAQAGIVDQYTSGWYLRKITTPDTKSAILLKYTPEKYRYGFKASTGGSGANTLITPSGGYRESALDIIGYRLKSIENTTGTDKVTFIAGAERTDLNGTPGFDTDKARRLSEINITNGGFCKKFTLSQDTFRDNSIYKTNQYTDYRLRLKSVQESNCNTPSVSVPPYEFTYYNNGDVNFLPNRLSSAIDHWGYYNGANGNPTAGYNIPFTRLRYTSNLGTITDIAQGFSNRETNADSMRIGTLQQIKYPTGGTTNFEYDANSYLSETGDSLKSWIPINSMERSWPTGYFSQTSPYQISSTTLALSFDDLSNTFFSWDYKKADNRGCINPSTCGIANINNNPSTVVLEVYQGSSVPSGATPLAYKAISNAADDQIYKNMTDKLLYLFPNLQPNVTYTFVLRVSNAASQIFFKKEILSAPYNRKVGGLRIAKVTNYDGANTANNIVKTYGYNKWTSVSSGKLYTQPLYGYAFDNIISACNPEITTQGTRFRFHYFSDASVVPLSSFEGYHIGYSHVTETINGLSTQYIYDLEDAENAKTLPRAPEQPRVKTGQLLSKTQYDINSQNVGSETNTAKADAYETGLGTYIKLNPFTFSGNQAAPTTLGGTLDATEYRYTYLREYYSNGVILSSSQTYSFTVNQYTPAGSTGGGSSNTITFWKKYSIRTRPYRLEKVETLVDNITSTTTYAYDSQNRFLMPTEVETKNSEGKTYTTKTYYSRNLPTLHLNSGIKDTFENKFMIGIPLQQEMLVNGTKRGGFVLEYKTYTGTGYSYLDFYPYRSFSLNRDSTRKLNVTVDAYEGGLPKQMTHITSATPQIFNWDDKKRLTNKNYGTLNWAVDYYNTSNLVKAVTDENGLMTKYTYDSLWRLSITQNRFNGTVDQPQNVQATTIYDYHYKNGAADFNYVGTSTSFINAANSTPLSTKQYMDGLGRPLEVVKEYYTPNVLHQKNYISYDALGRQNKAYLPFESNNLGFEAASTSATVHPFVLTEFETSPLSRPVKQTNVDGTTVLTSYGSNTATEVRLFGVNTEGGIVNTSYYTPAFLYKTTMTDENGKQTCVFKDKLGRVILTRKLLNNKRVDTYNIYDDYGQLTAVLPPGSVDSASGSVTYSLAFLYKYDKQNRLIEKKVPGADAQKFFYNKRDLLTLTQDGNMAHESPAKYLATQYDNLGRVVKTGWKFDTTGLWSGTITIADDDYKLTQTEYYPNKSWVKHQGAKVLKPTGVATNRNFVWSYIERRDGLTYTGNPVWTGKQHLLTPNQPERQILDADVAGVDWSVNGYDGAQKPTLSVRYLFTDGAANEVRTYQTYNYDNGQRLTDTKYMYALNGAGLAVPTFTLSNMNYNFKDQLIEKNIGFNGSTALQSIDYSYNLRGWLTYINGLNVYGNNNPIYTPSSIGASPIQNLMISPLVRQAMIDLATPYKSGQAMEMPPINDTNPDLFSEKIDYNSPDSRTGAPAQFNGNISAVTWQVAGRNKQAYGFKYDDLDRLTEATYFDLTDVNTGGQWNSTYSPDNKFWEKPTYDIRGNITSMKRNGMKAGTWTTNGYTAGTYGVIDDMNYTYNALNQVTRINDWAGNPNGLNNGKDMKGFVYDYAVGADDSKDHYEYDYNGNMKVDRHKGMTITYNYLNLPQVITFTGNRTITFVYDASGAKLQKIVKNNTAPAEVFNYVNGVEYKDNVLQRLPHTEGAVVRQVYAPTGAISYDHEYVLRDHLGNVRVTFTDGISRGDAYFDWYTWNYIDPNVGNTGYHDGVITQNDIKTINSYYPFGMDQEGNWNGSFDAVNNRYKYNEKEWNNDFGLGLYDYGARFYDPAVARWWSVDPLADKYMSLSDYHYAGNNPVKYIDVDGRYFIFKGTEGLRQSLSTSLNSYFGGAAIFSITDVGNLTIAELTSEQQANLTNVQLAIYNQIKGLNNSHAEIKFQLLDEKNPYQVDTDTKWTSSMYYIDGYDHAVLDVGDLNDLAASGDLGKKLVGPSIFHAFYEQFLGVIQPGGKLSYSNAHDKTVNKEFEVLGFKQTNDISTKDGNIIIRDIVRKNGNRTSYKIELDGETSKIKTIELFNRDSEEGKKFIKDNNMESAKSDSVRKD